MKNGQATVQEKTIVGKIATFLRHEITTTNYRAGAHLKESQISAEFGVSRVPVREAFRILQSEGYLEVIPNRGSFVKPISLSYIKKHARHSQQTHWNSVSPPCISVQQASMTMSV